MPFLPPSTALRVLALAVLAGLAALIANGLAAPTRLLAWRGSVALQPLSTPHAEPTPAPGPAPPVQAGVLPGPAPPDHPASPAARTVAPAPPAKPQAPVIASPIREISGEEAWVAFQAGAPFLDARRSAEFAEGHIAGAWCTPVWESDLDNRLISFKAARRPGPEDAIVIYCSGGDCRDSQLLAAKLLKEGYFRLLIYQGGYPDWVAQSHPIEKGHS